SRGIVDRIGGEALLHCTAGDRQLKTARPIRDQRAAVDAVLRWLASEESGPDVGGMREIDAVGHRVVHGGERFSPSVRIDPTVMREIEETIELDRKSTRLNSTHVKTSYAV